MRRLFAALCIAVLLPLTGCGTPATEAESERSAIATQAAPENSSPAAESESDKTTAASVPDLQVEVVHSFFADDPFARFAVKFTNPAKQTRVGAKAAWKALDKDGVIVGSYDTSLPPIGPGGTWHYVGGAGALLTGFPAQVKVEVTDQGALQDAQVKSLVSVEKADFERASFNLFKKAQSYDVTAVVVTSGDVATTDIVSAVLLMDASGKIIGSAWLDFTSAPDRLSAGEKVKATAIVAVVGGTPAKVEVYTRVV